MIKFFKDLNVKQLVLEAKYILIIAKDKEVNTLKELGKLHHKTGIYCRNGHILDTINGKIAKIDKKVDFDFNPGIMDRINKFLEGITDYEAFQMYVEYKQYFYKNYKIVLYWVENSAQCHYEKTTHLDSVGCGSLDMIDRHYRQINVNANIIRKIRLYPTLKDTLASFVNKQTTSKHYVESKYAEYDK